MKRECSIALILPKLSAATGGDMRIISDAYNVIQYEAL